MSDVPLYKIQNKTNIKPSATTIPKQNYTIPAISDGDKQLKAELTEFRLKLSREEGLKAFRVFSNATLEELVTNKPNNEEQLLKIKGIAEMKYNWFGEQLLTLILEHLDD